MRNNGLLNVQVGGSIDVGDAMFYIKTGQSEIAKVVQEGKEELDTHTTAKIGEFNTNATNKTNNFNANYTAKKALIDAEVQTAKDWATKTDAPVEGDDYSAKYYAQSLIPISSEIVTVAGIADDVAAVGAVASGVQAVADDLTAINAVNTNKTNIDTVAGSISNVNAVGGNISNVNAVAGNATNINAVNSNKTNIDAVAGSISNVNSVGSNISKVNAVYSDLSAIEAVNNNKTNIDTVATNISAVGNVSTNMSKVTNVSNNMSHVVGVDNNKTNIDAVAGNATNINKVAVSIVKVNNVGLNISKVTAVADDLTNVDTVAGNIANVNTVAGVSSAVSAVGAIADDLGDVIDNAANITTVAENISDVAAVGSNISNINTVAGDSTEINTCANNVSAINAAPTYANNSKIWAEGLDGEVAPLGGTHSAKGWAEIAEEAASGVQNPANRDLSNLTADGQMIIDSQNGTISNCILEIPQNLKCELSGATYTLKAGSIRTKLGATYTTITTESDITVTLDVSTDGRFVMIGSTDRETQIAIEKFDSGATTPSSKTTNYFWNTTDKLMYRWVSASSEYQAFTTWCYPSCLIDVVGGVVSFAKDSKGRDLIFNGCGYIGHHAFVFPNVSGLIPNKLSEDKTLSSFLAKVNALYIQELAGSTIQGYKRYIALNASGGIVPTNYAEVDSVENITSSSYNLHTYGKKENYIINRKTYTQTLQCVFIEFSLSGTTVTQFDIRQPYEGARNLLTDDIEEEIATKQVDVTTLTGYDSTKTQTLKNINGVLTWVTD